MFIPLAPMAYDFPVSIALCAVFWVVSIVLWTALATVSTVENKEKWNKKKTKQNLKNTEAYLPL